MLTTPSPLEALAAFAITFVAGIVTTAALGSYIGRLRKAAEANTPGTTSGTPA
jgi:VIT1/CCC1 family predicted Fe2+/Mn2+ transporter